MFHIHGKESLTSFSWIGCIREGAPLETERRYECGPKCRPYWLRTGSCLFMFEQLDPECFSYSRVMQNFMVTFPAMQRVCEPRRAPPFYSPRHRVPTDLQLN